jgi:hypothetical protein
VDDVRIGAVYQVVAPVSKARCRRLLAEKMDEDGVEISKADWVSI